jgi:outer membrane protein TolC
VGVFLSPMELVAGKQVADIRLMQMFPWFGVLKNAKDEMSLMAKASLASFESTKLDIAYDVRLRWYELYQNRQQVALLKKNLELLQQIKRLATGTYQAGGTSITASSSVTGSALSGSSPSGNGMGGMGTDIAKRPSINTPQTSSSGMAPSSGMGAASTGGLGNLYSIQQEENELANRLASLEDAYSYLTFGFNKLLNRAETASVEVPVGDFTDPFQPPVDTVLEGNPMLIMLDYEQKAQEARQKMAERMGYPMVGVGFNYSVISKSPSSNSMMNGQDMLMPMVSVSLPLNRKKYKAFEQEIAWQQSATSNAYEATRNALQADFKEALFRYRDALRRVQLVENQQQLVAKTYQLQRTRLAGSNGSLEELLRTTRQQVDYDLQLVNARVEVLNAQAKIRQLAGSY